MGQEELSEGYPQRHAYLVNAGSCIYQVRELGVPLYRLS